jgi:DNA-binding phage protein
MVQTRPFDVRNYLKTPEDRAAYLEAILEDGDPTPYCIRAWRHCQGYRRERICPPDRRSFVKAS